MQALLQELLSPSANQMAARLATRSLHGPRTFLPTKVIQIRATNPRHLLKLLLVAGEILRSHGFHAFHED